MVQYRIEWVAFSTNYRGNGDWHESKDKEMLNDWISYANKKYHDINHWLVTK